jgi:hypothetical protein
VLVMMSDIAESCLVRLRLVELDCFRGERRFFNAFPESIVGIVEVGVLDLRAFSLHASLWSKIPALCRSGAMVQMRNEVNWFDSRSVRSSILLG